MNQSDLTRQVNADLDRPFAVGGRRAYLIGHMNGRFPDLGHHLPGEMGGLWTPPIKIADGFWFGVSEDDGAVVWMDAANCRSFTMTTTGAEREFAVALPNGAITARQGMIVPESATGILLSVKLENASAAPRRLKLHWLTRFDIQGAWWSGWPDRADEAKRLGDGLVAWDSLRNEWAAAMVADQQPVDAQIGPDLWANEKTSSLDGVWGVAHGGIIPNPAELQGQGISGLLVYSVALAPGDSSELRGVLSSPSLDATDPQQAALNGAAALLHLYDHIVREKAASLDALLAAAPEVHSPRPDLDRVFAEQIPCLDMMTLDLPGVGHGLVAGLQGFAWFFGCDTYYSASGLLVSGQAGTAIDTLDILGAIGGRQNGRIPHELTQSGVLFNPGNPVESGEYVTAVERTFRWTGDGAFLGRVYPVCRAAIFDYLLGECDPHGDLLPDGPGLLELSSARHGKKLDVACCLYQGLESLIYLAQASGDSATVERASDLLPKVRDQIEKHFWSPERGEYLWRIEPDLSQHADEPAHTYSALELGLVDGADTARVEKMFGSIEGPEHTGPQGIVHPGTANFVMPIQNAIVALAEFRYGRPDRGLWYLERVSELAGHYMPWAIPEFVGHDSCFLQAWSSGANNWLLVQGMFRLLPDPTSGEVRVRPQLPTGWDFIAVNNLTLCGGRYNLRLDRKGDGIAFSAEEITRGPRRLRFSVEADPALPTNIP